MPPRTIRFQQDGGGGGGPAFSVFADIGGDNTNLKRALDDGLAAAKSTFTEMARLGGAFGLAGGGGVAGIGGVAQNLANIAGNQITEQRLRRQLDIQGFGQDAIERIVQTTQTFAAQGFATIAESQTALFNLSRGRVTEGLERRGPIGAMEEMDRLLRIAFGASQVRGTDFAGGVAATISSFQGGGPFPMLGGREIGGSPILFRAEAFRLFGENADQMLAEAQETFLGNLRAQKNMIGARLQQEPISRKAVDFATEATTTAADFVNSVLDGIRDFTDEMEREGTGARETIINRIGGRIVPDPDTRSEMEGVVDTIATLIRPALEQIDRQSPNLFSFVGRELNTEAVEAFNNLMRPGGSGGPPPSTGSGLRTRGTRGDPFMIFEPDVEGLNQFAIPGGADQAKGIAEAVVAGIATALNFATGVPVPIFPRQRRSPLGHTLASEGD